MQVKFLLSLPARSLWYQPQQDQKFKLANLRINIYHQIDCKFNQKIIPDGYEPKILSRGNCIEESRLIFAIKQEEDNILALPTKDKFREQPSYDGVPESILNSIIQQRRSLALPIKNRFWEQPSWDEVFKSIVPLYVNFLEKI